MSKALIDLAAERVLAIQDRGRNFTFRVARIQQEMWLKYFKCIDSREVRRGGEVEPSIDITTAGQMLLDNALLSAEGYLPGEGQKVCDIADWKQKLPAAHRRAIVNLLANAECDIDFEPDGVFGLDEVALRAIWTSNDKGEMVRVSPLVHRFATPTFDQERRYRRDSSRSIIVGGSRYSGETIYPGSQATNIGLYDEMISEVEGYVVDGKPLSGREQIAREMDAFHKCVAVELLFNPPGLSAVQAKELPAGEAA